MGQALPRCHAHRARADRRRDRDRRNDSSRTPTAFPDGTGLVPTLDARRDTIASVSQKLRDADPCALLRDPATLRPWGHAQRTAGPYLESCEATISTPGHSHDSYLQVTFQNPVPVSEIDGIPEQLGRLIVFREGLTHDNGRYECPNYLWAAHQPVIAINTRTYDDKPIDLCAVTEAATLTAITTLDHNGGINYLPHRISIYSHASSDACAVLNSANLGKVPGLNPTDPSPGFANRPAPGRETTAPRSCWSSCWKNPVTTAMTETAVPSPASSRRFLAIRTTALPTSCTGATPPTPEPPRCSASASKHPCPLRSSATWPLISPPPWNSDCPIPDLHSSTDWWSIEGRLISGQ